MNPDRKSPISESAEPRVCGAPCSPFEPTVTARHRPRRRGGGVDGPARRLAGPDAVYLPARTGGRAAVHVLLGPLGQRSGHLAGIAPAALLLPGGCEQVVHDQGFELVAARLDGDLTSVRMNPHLPDPLRLEELFGPPSGRGNPVKRHRR